MSISLLVGRRDRKRINSSVNHVVVRIEDDINYVVGLMCQYESSLCAPMGTMAYEDVEYAYLGE